MRELINWPVPRHLLQEALQVLPALLLRVQIAVGDDDCSAAAALAVGGSGSSSSSGCVCALPSLLLCPLFPPVLSAAAGGRSGGLLRVRLSLLA